MKDKNIVGIEKYKKYVFKKLINLRIRKNIIIIKMDNERQYLISKTEMENFLKENNKK